VGNYVKALAAAMRISDWFCAPESRMPPCPAQNQNAGRSSCRSLLQESRSGYIHRFSFLRCLIQNNLVLPQCYAARAASRSLFLEACRACRRVTTPIRFVLLSPARSELDQASFQFFNLITRLKGSILESYHLC
jgi:hypothetical protein